MTSKLARRLELTARLEWKLFLARRQAAALLRTVDDFERCHDTESWFDHVSGVPELEQATVRALKLLRPTRVLRLP